MEINQLPAFDWDDNPTGCCPKFQPDGWDEQEIHLRDKLFVKGSSRSFFHIPLNIGSVFAKIGAAMDAVDAVDRDAYVALSDEVSLWRADHYFAANKDVPGQNMVRLTGDYLTKVFEGPFKDAGRWCDELDAYAKAQGKTAKKQYFFYTTCPKCAKAYGKNYVVGFAEV